MNEQEKQNDRYTELLNKIDKWYQTGWNDKNIKETIKRIKKLNELDLVPFLQIIKKCIKCDLKDAFKWDDRFFKVFYTGDKLDFIQFKYYHDFYTLRITANGDDDCFTFRITINKNFTYQNRFLTKLTEYKFTTNNIDEEHSYIYLLINDDVDKFEVQFKSLVNSVISSIEKRIG